MIGSLNGVPTSEEGFNMHRERNWIYALLTLGGGLVGGIAATQLAPVAADAALGHHTIKAESFVLVDKKGVQRAALEVSANGLADLVMYDGEGTDRAELRVAKDGASTLGFYGENGTRRVLIGAVRGGRNGVTVYGADNRLLAGLTVSENDEPALTLYDPKNGRARAGLGVADESSAVALYDDAGRDRAELHVNASGKPGLALADENGKSIAGLPQKEAAPQQ
jgi:hypothetical protein